MNLNNSATTKSAFRFDHRQSYLAIVIVVPSFWALLVVFGLLVYLVWLKCFKFRTTNNHIKTTKAETEVAVVTLVNSADEPGSNESGFKKFKAAVPSKSSAKVKITPENN